MAEDLIPRPLSDDQLRAAAEHVCYELQQVAYGTYRTSLVRTDRRGNTDPADLHLARALLEAYLIHLRVLDDFLGKTIPHKEDVLAVDFCPEYIAAYALTTEQRTDIDRRVAHLTLRRTDGFQWGKRRPYTTAVVNEFRKFLRTLEQHHPERAAWIKPELHAARRFLRESLDGWPQHRTV